MASNRTMSVTPVVSHQEPTDDDITLSNNLSQAIQQLNVYLTEEEWVERDEMISYLAGLVQKWVCKTAVEQPQGRKDDCFGATAIAFGGHALGVVTKESDLDVVCIVPSFIERADFFSTFVDLLKTEFGEALTRIRLVTASRVPIIEICLQKTEVDLCLACMNMDVIPDDLDLSDNTLLKGMEVTDVRSLNGVREIRNTLQVVPDQHTFHETLKAIKLWAKAKSLHHSVIGYPGGMAWAIMVARVCQQYPNAAPATLVHKFFKIYSDWPWPAPVMLTTLNRSDPYHLKPWNPKGNPGDRLHKMPVITPAYPEKNCASTVTKSALQLVTRQLHLALQIVEKIFEKSDLSWELLFNPLDFFSMYKHFLMLTASADNPADHLDWSGLVQARSRQFLESLQDQASIQLVHAYPKAFNEGCSTKWFWGLEFTSAKGIKLSIAEDLHQFQQHLSQLSRERGINRPGMLIECHHIRKKDLSTVLPS